MKLRMMSLIKILQLFIVDPVNDTTAETDGEEPLNEDIVESILSNFDGIKKLRLSCEIHSLQSVVCDGLKSSKFMSLVLSKASRLSNMLHTSGLFADAFFVVFKKTIQHTNNTRWNSTFIQLEALSKLDPTKLNVLLTEHTVLVIMDVSYGRYQIVTLMSFVLLGRRA